uniref:Uncharacterized protein n=1 Tax=Cucumis melo TaxID=3656 RepID=A0A9I9D928_CUCME
MRRRAAGRRQTRPDEGRTAASGSVSSRGRSEMVRPRRMNVGVAKPSTTETETEVEIEAETETRAKEKGWRDGGDVGFAKLKTKKEKENR